LKNLETDAIDLLQLHCPPTDLYYAPEVFGLLDDFVKEGKIRFYGVSVERVEEALKAVEYPGVQTVQIIYNVFRQRPADLFFARAMEKKVGILARLPLSSGLLAGKMTRETAFARDDHRAFNRNGEAFDRGETFSGIDFGLGLELVERLKPLVPAGTPMSAWAIAWILSHPAVTCSIPGAKSPEQVDENVVAADLPALSESTLRTVQELYDSRVKAQVHQYW
jgi:aryl-alcohol dehydrogenase-like predicted oxidoreductase